MATVSGSADMTPSSDAPQLPGPSQHTTGLFRGSAFRGSQHTTGLFRIVEESIDFVNVSQLLGSISIHYLSYDSWVEAKNANTQLHDVTRLACRCVSWIIAFHENPSSTSQDLCYTCGWQTGTRISDPIELCAECMNVGVCADCTYVSGGQSWCFQCDIQPDAPHWAVTFERFLDICCHQADYVTGTGYYYKRVG